MYMCVYVWLYVISFNNTFIYISAEQLTKPNHLMLTPFFLISSHFITRLF